ncbi:MAG TPA: VIT1/CCC1 transporter family protein [Gammaproteobacteria bacterium]
MGLIQSWHEEKQSAWLYRLVAQVEGDVTKSRLFTQLAEAAEEQALIWQRQIEAAGETLPSFAPSLRARAVARLLHLFGPRATRPVLAAMKVRGISVYSAAKPAGHHPMPTSVSDFGRRHRSVGGGNLRAAVFGINDGLVSNASLIMGVAGAASDNTLILTAGVAGLLAGALSMAAGEYVSMRSQRELFEYQIGLERDELEEYPEEEAEELALIYHARGVALEEARAIAKALMQEKEHALDTLAREELGLNPDDLGSPWGAAISSFLAFTVGAVIPLIPFLLSVGNGAVVISAGLAGIGLFVVGALLSLFTGRGALLSGLRMVLIGGGAGVITYLIGHLLGVSLG